MRTFDSALFQLYKEGRISLEEAINNADSANNLRLRIKLDKNAAASDKEKSSTGSTSLSLEEMPDKDDGMLHQ